MKKYVVIYEDGWVDYINAKDEDEALFELDNMSITEDGFRIMLPIRLAKRVAKTILNTK